MLFVIIAALATEGRSVFPWPVDWVAFVTTLGTLLAAWIYALLVPLSVMPVERGAFQMLWVERQATNLSRVAAKLRQRDSVPLLASGRHWQRLTARYGDDYLRHRQAHTAFFFLARCLAAASLLSASAVAGALLIHAIAHQSLALAYGGGAVLALGLLPAVVTVLASRYRWQRRVPFEVLWTHEATTVLSKHYASAARGTLERSEVLSDIGDVEYILSRRHRYSPSGSSRRRAQEAWGSRTSTLVASSAEFEGRASVASGDVSAWLGSHIDQASWIVMQDHAHVTGAAAAQNNPSRYSTDRAALAMTGMLTVAVVALSIAALIAAGVTSPRSMLESFQPLLTDTSSLLAPVGGLVPLVAWFGRKRLR